MAIHPLRVTLAIFGGASIVVGAVGSWYLVTPRMTMEAMADAAVRGDAEKLTSYMDMKELRRDMRRRASRALASRYPPGRVVLDNDLVTEALAGSLIDHAFSLEGARNAVRGHGRAIRTRADVQYRIIRDGPNHFVARLDQPRRVDLLFTRNVAGWLLTGIAQRPPLEPKNLI